MLAGKGYEADRLRRELRQAGAVPVIPADQLALGRSATIASVTKTATCRKCFCRLEDFRRVATRYYELAANFLSRVAFATALAFRL